MSKRKIKRNTKIKWGLLGPDQTLCPHILCDSEKEAWEEMFSFGFEVEALKNEGYIAVKVIPDPTYIDALIIKSQIKRLMKQFPELYSKKKVKTCKKK